MQPCLLVCLEPQERSAKSHGKPLPTARSSLPSPHALHPSSARLASAISWVRWMDRCISASLRASGPVREPLSCTLALCWLMPPASLPVPSFQASLQASTNPSSQPFHPVQQTHKCSPQFAASFRGPRMLAALCCGLATITPIREWVWDTAVHVRASRDILCKAAATSAPAVTTTVTNHSLGSYQIRKGAVPRVRERRRANHWYSAHT